MIFTRFRKEFCAISEMLLARWIICSPIFSNFVHSCETNKGESNKHSNNVIKAPLQYGRKPNQQVCCCTVWIWAAICKPSRTHMLESFKDKPLEQKTAFQYEMIKMLLWWMTSKDWWQSPHTPTFTKKAEIAVSHKKKGNFHTGR